jgi:hypothetical protein
VLIGGALGLGEAAHEPISKTVTLEEKATDSAQVSLGQGVPAASQGSEFVLGGHRTSEAALGSLYTACQPSRRRAVWMGRLHPCQRET